MKQFFRFFAVLFMSVFATASWAQGNLSNPLDYAIPLTVDEPVYVYNVGQGKYLNCGEAWGTQSIVAETGFVYQVKDAHALNNTLPEGTYYFWSSQAGGQHWMSRIGSDGRANGLACFSDGTNAHNSNGNANQIAWNINLLADNLYTIEIPAGFDQYVEGTQQYLGVDPQHQHGDYGQADGTTNGVWWDIDITTQAENCTWAFISVKMIYADNELKPLIDEAKEKGVPAEAIAAAESAYNNRAALTYDDLVAAYDALSIYLATPNKPAFVDLIVSPTAVAHKSLPTGWEGETFGDSSDNVSEYWNKSGVSFHQTVPNVPSGVYELQVIALTRTNMKSYIRVKKGEEVIGETLIATVPSSEVNNRSQASAWFNNGNGLNKIMFELEEASDIDISLTADATTGDHWTVWRSFKLYNLGNGIETWTQLAQRYLSEGWENWQEEFVGQFAQQYFDPALYDAADAVDGATTAEEAKAAYYVAKNAVEAFNKNVELVTKLQDNIAALDEEHRAIGEDRAGDPEVDPCDALLETAQAWIEAIDDDDVEGMAEVTNEALEQWFADWEVAFKDCLYYKMQQMTPGEEGNCNKLLVNPGFKDNDGKYTTTGWTITGTAPNFFNAFPLVAEVWNANFDASQTIELPVDGAYSLHTHGFYRTGNTDVAWERWQAAGNQETQNLTGANSENTCRAYLYADNLTERFSNTFHNIYTRAQVEALANAYYDQDFLDTYLKKADETYYEKSGGGKLEETFDEMWARSADASNPYDFSYNKIATKEQVQSDPDIAAFIPNGVYSAHAVFSSPDYGDDYNMAINFLGRKGQVVKVGVKAENIQAQGWTIFQPFKLTWYGKDVNKLQEVMQKVLDNATTLAAEPMQKDTLAALNAGLAAAQQAIADQNGDELLAAYDAINAAYGPAEQSVNAYIPLVNKKAELDAAIIAYPDAMAETKAAAEALQSEVAGIIAGGTITSDQIPAKIAEMALVIKHLPISNQPGDFTGVIENPQYIVNDAASLAGWSYDATDTATKALAPGAEKQSVAGVNMGIVEGWNNSDFNFNIYQDIDGLPNGYYLVTVQGAFRPFANDISLRRMGLAATADAPVTSLDGVNALYAEIADSLTYMYANDETAVLQSLYILPTDERDLAQWADNNGGTGSWFQSFSVTDPETQEATEYFVQEIGDEKTYAYIPGNRAAVAYRFGTRHFADQVEEFASGEFFFTNKLSVQVTDGNLRIGVRNRNAAANSWSPITNWHLYYIGTEGPATDGINELSDNTAKTVKTTVYSIDGRQMNSAARGVNIVKTRDNNGKETVRKVIVK